MLINVSHLGTGGDNFGANHNGTLLKETGHVMLPGFLAEDRLARILAEITARIIMKNRRGWMTFHCDPLSINPGVLGRASSMMKDPQQRVFTKAADRC